MKRISFLLLLVLLASTAYAVDAPPGDFQVSAKYLETVTYIDSVVQHAPSRLVQGTGEAPGSGMTIVRDILGGVAGSSSYVLAAADVRGNQAVYEEFIVIDDPLGVTTVEPSAVGMSDAPRRPLIISTVSEASCEWDYLGITDPVFKPMESTSDGLQHAVLSLADFRTREGEAVPIIVRCTDASGSLSERVVPFGWTDGPTSFDASLWPVPIAEPDGRLRVTATSDLPIMCSLSAPSLPTPLSAAPGLRHVFADLPSGANGEVYTVECFDAHGVLMPQRELVTRQNFAGNELAIGFLEPHLPVNTDAPVLSVETNTPARCEQSLTNGLLGPVAGGIGHQRALSLSGSDSGTVSCETADGNAASIDVDVLVDTTDPIVRMPTRPERCEDMVLIEISGSDDSSIAYVRVASTSEEVLREWPAGGDTITIQQAGLGVLAGDMISVQGIDAAGNIGEEFSLSVVDSPNQETCGARGITQDLRLVAPPDGASEDDSFSVIIGSEVESTCEWRTSGDWTAFTSSDGFSHVLAQFETAPGITRHAENALDVRCTDAVSQVSEESFVIAWDMTAPAITLSADPETVTDLISPYTTIGVTSDQNVVCKYDDGGYTAVYGPTHEFEVPIAYGEGERTVSVSCKNRGGKETTESITFYESYPSEMIINVLTPEALRTPTFSLSVRTSLYATCTAVIDGNDVVLQTDNNVEHSRQVTLSEGSHVIPITCAEFGDADSTAFVDFSITIDRSPPTVTLENKALTCGLADYTILGSVEDNVGVDTVHITFNDRNYTASSLPYTIKGLSLNESVTYTLRVYAVDTLGNPSSVKTRQVKAAAADEGACDTEPPDARLIEEHGNGYADVYVLCRDNQGCKDAYEMGFGPEDGACKMSTYRFSRNDTLKVEKSGKVCYRVEDLSGNIVEDSELVGIITRPEYCFNDLKDEDETGVDCGGSCAPCAPGNETNESGCVLDSDCKSGVCKDDVCAANACENVKQDGTETDVDCGGFTCEPCTDGKTCESSFDCTSKSCVKGVCTAATCSDLMKNGGETGKDCGGPVCEKCEIGEDCLGDSDCLSGICSSGTCTSTRLREEETGQVDNGGDGDETPEKKSIFWALFFIIVGILLVMGGGGYIWYERGHPAARPGSKPSQGFGDTSFPSGPGPGTPASGGTDTPAQPTQPGYDFGKSKLREEARKKRRAARKADRKDLLSEFSKEEQESKRHLEPHERRPQKDPHSDVGSEDTHKRLDSAKTPDQIKDAAAEMLAAGDADKHEVSSALADKHAAGEIDQDALDDLRESLGLR